MLLQYIHRISLPDDAIYFVKCTSPSCSKAPPQHDAATPVLHIWDGVLQLASLPLFPPKITMVIMAKQYDFCFIRPEDISPKKYDLCPHVQLQTVVWLFYGNFEAVASSLLSGPSGYVDIGLILLWRYFCTCFLQHLHRVLCCCSGIDLHFSQPKYVHL